MTSGICGRIPVNVTDINSLLMCMSVRNSRLKSCDGNIYIIPSYSIHQFIAGKLVHVSLGKGKGKADVSRVVINTLFMIFFIVKVSKAKF